MPFEKQDDRINRNGRPKGAKNSMTKLKETLVSSVSENDIIDLVDKLKQKAIDEGCIQSIKLLLEHAIGKPSQMIINQNYDHNGAGALTELLKLKEKDFE